MIGLRIKELRKTANMTQAQLAKFAGVEPRQISNYELYGAWPTPETLNGLLDGLEVELHVFFDITDTRKRALRPLVPLRVIFAKDLARSAKRKPIESNANGIISAS